MNNKLKLVLGIGEEICPECNDGADCGQDPNYCTRVHAAIYLLDKFIHDNKDKYNVTFKFDKGN